MKHYITIFLLLFNFLFFSSCVFKSNDEDKECSRLVNSSILFLNFNFDELQNTKIQYIDSQKRHRTVIVDFNQIHYNYEDKSVLTENSFNLEKDVRYSIVTKNDTTYLKLDSIGIQYQNTMFSVNQVCGVIKYSVNNKEFNLKYLVIDKNNW